MPVQKKISKWKIVVFAFLLLMLSLVLHYKFFNNPKQLNSGIFKTEKVFSGHTNVVWSVQFSPDGNLIASGGVDSTVKIWKRSDGIILNELKHPSGVTYLQFSEDGQSLQHPVMIVK